jgi:hypothetical protein
LQFQLHKNPHIGGFYFYSISADFEAFCLKKKKSNQGIKRSQNDGMLALSGTIDRLGKVDLK